MKTFIISLGLLTVAVAAVAAAPTDCKNGETWTKDGIKFECRVDGLTTGFYPIACVAEGKEHKDGETWLQDYFKYECKQEGKEKMKFEIVACLTPKNKKEFGIGEKKIDENKKCDCNRDSSGKVKLRCDDVCTLDDGSELPINEKKSLGKILVQCQKSGNGLKLIEIACKLPESGQELNSNNYMADSDKKWYICEPDKKDSDKLVLTEFKNHECTSNSTGKKHDPWNYWNEGSITYRCFYKEYEWVQREYGCHLELDGKSYEIRRNEFQEVGDQIYFCDWNAKELIVVTEWAKCKQNGTEVALKKDMIDGEGKYGCNCDNSIRNSAGKVVGLNCKFVLNYCVLSIKNSKGEEKVVSFTKWPSKAADDQYYACNYKTGKVVRLGKGTCEFDSKTVEYEKTVSKNGTAYKCNYHIDEYKMVMSAYGCYVNENNILGSNEIKKVNGKFLKCTSKQVCEFNAQMKYICEMQYTLEEVSSGGSEYSGQGGEGSGDSKTQATQEPITEPTESPTTEQPTTVEITTHAPIKTEATTHGSIVKETTEAPTQPKTEAITKKQTEPATTEEPQITTEITEQPKNPHGACLSATDYVRAGAEVFKSITTDEKDGNTEGKKHGEPAVSRKKRCSKRRYASNVALILLGTGGRHNKGCEESSSSSEEETPKKQNCNEFKREVRWVVTAACPKTCKVCDAVKSKNDDYFI